jgi:hypothetical protein
MAMGLKDTQAGGERSMGASVARTTAGLESSDVKCKVGVVENQGEVGRGQMLMVDWIGQAEILLRDGKNEILLLDFYG